MSLFDFQVFQYNSFQQKQFEVQFFTIVHNGYTCWLTKKERSGASVVVSTGQVSMNDFCVTEHRDCTRCRAQTNFVARPGFEEITITSRHHDIYHFNFQKVVTNEHGVQIVKVLPLVEVILSVLLSKITLGLQLT